MGHETIEKSVGLLGVLTALAISVGGLAEIVPLMATQEAVTPADGVLPYTPEQLEGRDVYIREGCYVCHSQMIRPFRAETERYGHYSLAGETVYDHPFQFGSKRTGPDLARVGGLYTIEWHRAHLLNPRDLVPESNMPGFPWLAGNTVDASLTPVKMQRLRAVGVPYTDADIATAAAQVEGKTDMDVLIAYLQGLGTDIKGALNVDAGVLRGIFTVLMLVLFIGICFWAWSRKRKPMFEAAARQPLEHDDGAPPRQHVDHTSRGVNGQ